MSWSNRYIGIPWAREDGGRSGTHCWGLVRLVYAEQFGIELADYGGSQGERTDAVLIADKRREWPWQTIQQPRPGDVAVFQIGGVDDHVGIIVEGRLMLHVARGRTAEVVSIDAPQWRHRLAGLHRHAGMNA